MYEHLYGSYIGAGQSIIYSNDVRLFYGKGNRVYA